MGNRDSIHSKGTSKIIDWPTQPLPISFSVVIPARNTEKTLSRTLDSLLSQNHTKWECIIVDNASEDGTSEVARSYSKRDPRFRVVYEPIEGVSQARNRGIAEAESDWLLFLDADDWILPEFFSKLGALLSADSSLDAAICGCSRVNSSGETITSDSCIATSDMFPRFATSSLAIHSCVVRRKCVEAAGGFDPELQTCEDWDLWQRIARFGARFASIPDCLAIYYTHANSACRNVEQLLRDGLRVIEQGHSHDSRVYPRLPQYEAGFAGNLAQAQWTYFSWIAGLSIGQGASPSDFWKYVPGIVCPELSPNTIANQILASVQISTGRPAHDWPMLWDQFKTEIIDFLSMLEDHSKTTLLRRRVQVILERTILQHARNLPWTGQFTHGRNIEISEPIPDIALASEIERIILTIRFRDRLLGNIELPTNKGHLAETTLSEAIAEKFGWEILREFFATTLYGQLTIDVDDNGMSVWRGDVCLAKQLTHAPVRPYCELHDQIGWTVFLQEFWGRPDWNADDFYDCKKRAAMEEGTVQQVSHLTSLELASPLPEFRPQQIPTRFDLTIAGTTAAKMQLTAPATPQQLRVAATELLGLDLVKITVREVLLGKPFEDATLRQLLRSKIPIEAIPHQSHFSLFSSDGPEHGTGGMDYGPASAKGEPNLKTADLVSVLDKTSGPAGEAMPRAVAYNRHHFETLFAKSNDPWRYTTPYETVKYQQTLSMLPKKRRFWRALEIGCAEGHFSRQLAERVEELMAADISDIALRRAADRCAKNKNVHFTQIDLIKDDLPQNRDLIVCSELLYYLEDLDTLRKAAQKIAGALAPGGFFLTAHAFVLADDSTATGFDWDFSFGAKVIGDVFTATPRLRLVRQLQTPLYQIQLFQKETTLHRIREALSVNEQPSLEKAFHAPPPPEVAKSIRWQGGAGAVRRSCLVSTTRLPILMYHRVSDTGAESTRHYRVSPGSFESQLRYLRDCGFRSVSLSEWHEARRRRKPLDGRCILFTFDDGCVDFKTEAWPLLKEYGYSAIVFAVTSHVGGFNSWDAAFGEKIPLLSWEDLHELSAEGVEIGSHTMTHAPLTGQAPAEIIKEASTSRCLIELNLEIPASTFAYPHGDTDPVAEHLVGACGYEWAFTCRHDLAGFNDSRLALPRIEITGADTLEDFVRKISGVR